MAKKAEEPSSGIGRRRAAAKDEASETYQARRAEIKAAAAALFKRDGFRGTSIGRIAAAAGIDRATLYYYVGSKEELFDDVVTEAVRTNVAVGEAIRDGEGTAPEKLRALALALMTSYADNYPFLYVFIQENLGHVSSTRSQWSRQMRSMNKRYEDLVTGVIRSGIDEGSIRPISEPWLMAYGFIGMLGWTNRWFNPQQSTADAATIATAYADMLLGGMVVDDGRTVSGRTTEAGASPPKPARPAARRRTA